MSADSSFNAMPYAFSSSRVGLHADRNQAGPEARPTSAFYFFNSTFRIPTSEFERPFAPCPMPHAPLQILGILVHFRHFPVYPG